MTKQEIEKLVDRYDAKAEKAFRTYQETGIQRYEREQHNAEDLADALRIAMNAQEDHDKLINLRAQLVWWASEAEQLLKGPREAPVESLLRDLIAFAGVTAGFKKQEEI